MKTNNIKQKALLILLLMAAGFGLSSCTKQSGCKFVEGNYYTGTFQYYKEPLDNIGNNVHAELIYEYGGMFGTIYFDGSIPKEFRTEEAVKVALVGEPIGLFHYYPIYHKIKCIEKID